MTTTQSLVDTTLGLTLRCEGGTSAGVEKKYTRLQYAMNDPCSALVSPEFVDFHKGEDLNFQWWRLEFSVMLCSYLPLTAVIIMVLNTSECWIQILRMNLNINVIEVPNCYPHFFTQMLIFGGHFKGGKMLQFQPQYCVGLTWAMLYEMIKNPSASI